MYKEALNGEYAVNTKACTVRSVCQLFFTFYNGYRDLRSTLLNLALMIPKLFME